jgi:hypothetical protein
MQYKLELHGIELNEIELHAIELELNEIELHAIELHAIELHAIELHAIELHAIIPPIPHETFRTLHREQEGYNETKNKHCKGSKNIVNINPL